MRPTTKVIPSEKLFVSEPNPLWFGNGENPAFDPTWTNKNWLKSRFHFSFAEYNNSKNLDYGVLRVMNDDLVQPHRGFGTHGHRNMEIVTYIVQGELTHEDSMGTKESLGRGSIQFMTAGVGVQHSEFNHGNKPLRFIQTWIQPSSHSLTPNYGSYNGVTSEAAEKRRNKLQHLVSNVNKKEVAISSTPVHISQDADVFASEMDLGEKVQLEFPEGRQAYLLCIEGSVVANGEKLQKYDAAEIVGNGSTLVIQATDVEDTENGKLAHILLITMKASPGSGRTDI